MQWRHRNEHYKRPQTLHGLPCHKARFLLAAQARREQEGGIKGGMSAWQRWSSMRILLRSQLFKRLTVVYMLTGIVSQGLMELLTQYLQIKLSFNTKDQVGFRGFRVCTGGSGFRVFASSG